MAGSGAGRSDAAHAVRFLAIKAAIFILIPLAAAIVAVLIVMAPR